MRSFTLVAGSPCAPHRLRAAARATESLMPRLDAPLTSHTRALPAIDGGWSHGSCPDPTGAGVFEADRGELAVLCYGTLHAAPQPAQALLDAFASSGLTAARDLSGSFVAVIVERAAQRLHVFTDLLGQLAPQWCVDRGALLLSPHAVPLVAASEIDTRFDLTAACSLLTCDWSVGGAPLLASLTGLHPTEVLTWERGQVRVARQPRLFQGPRIDARDHTGIARTRTRVIDTLAAEARALTDRTEVELSLTAGADSRALLALFATGDLGRLRAVTGGAPTDLDVLGARALSHAVGIPHRRRTPPAPDPAQFDRMLAHYAFHLNGATNAKRCLTAPEPGPLRVTGGAGEIYRGYYYPAVRRLPPSEVSHDAVIEALTRKLVLDAAPLPPPLPQLPASQLAAVADRLRASLVEMAGYCPTPHDLLDVAYLYERYAFWGALVAKRSFWPMVSPLASPAAVTLAYQLPAPIGDHCNLIAQVVREQLPALAYWLPVNGQQLLPLSPTSPVNRCLSLGDQLRRGTLQRLTHGGATPAARSFAGALHANLRDRLLAKGSVTRQLFDADGARQLLTHHRRHQDLLQPLGFLATLEAFREQVAEARRLRPKAGYPAGPLPS